MNVQKILGVKKSDGDVGIELECEGNNMREIGTTYWRTEHDGSLRGRFPETCAEFIFKKPLKIDQVPAAMNEFHESLPHAKFEFSFRTSCHVHVNVQELDYPELLAFMYTYLLLEEPLMHLCGQTRKGNRFCLRYADAEGLGDILHVLFTVSPRALKAIPKDVYRYAAMNIDAIGKYGSLEFRGMHGTADKQLVYDWAKTLVNIRSFAQKMGNPREVFEYYTHFGAEKFIRTALGDKSELYMLPGYADEIAHSFSLTMDLPFAYKHQEIQLKMDDLIKQTEEWEL
jgi:hypothetical protein